MAIRIRTTFHDKRARTPAVLAGAVAVPAWKLAIESIGRMRRADYDIDIGRPYFEFVSEYLVFLATAADRIAHRELAPVARVEFTTALVKTLARFAEENNGMLLGAAAPGECERDFLERFNRRGADYAAFEYGDDGPDFGFRRYFAACLQEVLPEKDRLWVIDQAMDIESPAAIKALEKTLAGLFAEAAGE